MRGKLPNISWSDDELIAFAKRYCLPIVKLRLFGVANQETTNSAEINFTVIPTTIRRM